MNDYARYMLEGCESYLGALQERFNVSDSLTNFGKMEGVSVKTAHAVFKLSGLPSNVRKQTPFLKLRKL